DRGNIKANFNSIGEVTFTDKNVVSDNIRNYAPNGSDFCRPDTIVSNPDKLKTNIGYGINVSPAGSFSATAANGQTTLGLDAEVKLGFKGAAGACQGVLFKAKISNPDGVAEALFKWNGASISTLDGAQDQYTFDQGSGLLYLSGSACGTSTLRAILLDSSGSSTGKYYELQDIGFNTSNIPGQYPALNKPEFGFSAGCNVLDGSFKTIRIAGASSGTGPSSSTSSSTTDDTSACILNSNTTLEWLACPVITAISKTADGLNKLVEDQLNFKTQKFLTPDVHKVWAIFKNLVSSMLVIVMLIMVFAQAIGSQRLDAYTVKKMLPRLVIAVIGMQISWDLCQWIIGLANHAGEGIGQIMAAPFGGAGNLDLGSLLNHLNPVWAGVTSVTLVALLFAAPTLGFLFLPGVALAAFGVFMSVLVALATLLFRNALIITLVMVSPIALLLWVFPGSGTQKYWKLWTDNFTKILLLFPIMISVIYGGRIFAYVAGGLQPPGVLDFVMVLIGFFAPYAILPKAFKWGGSFLSAAYRNAGESGLTKRLRDSGNRLVGQDFNNYWKGRMARERYDPYDKKYGVSRAKVRGKSIPIPILRGRLAGRLGSQHLMPTAHGRAQALREGATWAGERKQDAEAFDRRMFDLAQEHGYAVDEEDKAFLPGLPENKNRKAKKYTNARGEEKEARWEPGVAAAKQALVDLTSIANSGDKRVSQMAIDLLVATSSNPEIENNVVTHGPEAGTRVFRTKTSTGNTVWEEYIGGSDKYGTIAQSNYDLQTHVLQYKYDKERPDPKKNPLAAFLYDKALVEGHTPKDLEAGTIRMDDPERTLYVMAKDATLNELSPQSLGFWQRQQRHQRSGDKETQQAIGDALLLKQFAKLVALGPGGVGQFAPFRGEKEDIINRMLAESGAKTLDGKNITVDNLVDMAGDRQKLEEHVAWARPKSRALGDEDDDGPPPPPPPGGPPPSGSPPPAGSPPTPPTSGSSPPSPSDGPETPAGPSASGGLPSDPSLGGGGGGADDHTGDRSRSAGSGAAGTRNASPNELIVNHRNRAENVSGSATGTGAPIEVKISSESMGGLTDRLRPAMKSEFNKSLENSGLMDRPRPQWTPPPSSVSTPPPGATIRPSESPEAPATEPDEENK
ncbi:MAG: hypothetical protein JWO96_97, partial [Candidatus Saccharibacteria bacterium]|nr:hypothetical protein [Candidatus Saccharibacteria bacterium]